MVDSTGWTEKIEGIKMIPPKIKVYLSPSQSTPTPLYPLGFLAPSCLMILFCFGKNRHAAIMFPCLLEAAGMFPTLA
jgi:hypothetical protein